MDKILSEIEDLRQNPPKPDPTETTADGINQALHYWTLALDTLERRLRATQSDEKGGSGPHPYLEGNDG